MYHLISEVHYFISLSKLTELCSLCRAGGGGGGGGGGKQLHLIR